ncbi:hypothetical protein E4U53_006166, partial [Claviceps sorghi]
WTPRQKPSSRPRSATVPSTPSWAAPAERSRARWAISTWPPSWPGRGRKTRRRAVRPHGRSLFGGV